MQVAISHPHGNPNSFNAARALFERGWLHSFYTGFAKGNGNNFPAPTITRHLWWQAASKTGRYLRPGGLTARVNWYDVLFCAHDWQVSRALHKGIAAVYAYEDAAKLTLETAGRRGIAKMYELPSGYYAGVANELERARKASWNRNFSIKPEPSWKQVRKDRELELADLVVVPSEWARESLCFANVARKEIVKVPYGTPAADIPARTKRHDGPFTILFAGQIGVRKGVPILLEAWKRLALKDARMLMAGSMNLHGDYFENQNGCEYLGTLSRLRLLESMRSADLLVFPSLADGFGLVIGEAMAVGLPVLTTRNTGGPELITDGREGWCVPAHDVESLSARIEWAYQNRDTLYEMGTHARTRAEQWTWADYRIKLTDELAKYLGV